MFRGFNLTLGQHQIGESYYKTGNNLYLSNTQEVKRALDSYVLVDGSLDGFAMQSDWFPQVEADIFLSHSHGDEKTAIALAGWLHDNFGLKVFIDSCIWGYSNELLKTIDNKYCMQPDGLYNYPKRNESTSHVHMMLSTALMKMIDRTECLFFLNTPRSIATSEVIDKTESPWIYSELSMTQVLRQNIPERLKVIITETYSGADGILQKGAELRIKYLVDLSHLIDIDSTNLNTWQKNYKGGNALDKLYELNTF